MKNRLKLFNFGLYKEGLRLTKDITLTFMFILTMISVLLPLGIAAVLMEQGENMERITVGNLNFIYMYLIFLIVAPVLVIMLFHFLSKRRSCDVFDSFPQRRETIFFSFMCSIATWLLLITLETFTVSSAMYAMLGKYFIYDYDGFFMALRYCLSIFICSLLVAAGFAFAYACNGTVITTIATAYSILIAPRLMISAPLICLWLFSDLLAVKPTIPFFDHNINLLFASIFSPNDSFVSAGSIAYTLIILVILLVLGLISFKKRKSETAGRCGANRAIISLTQVGLVVVAVLPIPFYIAMLMGIFTNLNDDSLLIFEILIFLFFYVCFSFLQCEAVSIGLMIGYEAIASRGLKKFKKFLLCTIPTFIIMQLIMFLIVTTSYIIETNIKVPPQYISKVTIIDGSYIVKDDLFPEYQNKEITDPEFIEEISELLDKNIDEYLYSDSDSENYVSLRHDLVVSIKAGPIIIYRNLSLTESDYNRLLGKLHKY